MKHYKKSELETMKVAQLKEILLTDFNEEFNPGVKKAVMVDYLAKRYREQAAQERRQAKIAPQAIPAQGKAPQSAAGTVIEGTSHITYQRMLSIRGALMLEVMTKGTHAYRLAMKEYHLKGTKQQVFDQLNMLICQKQQELAKTHMPDD